MFVLRSRLPAVCVVLIVGASSAMGPVRLANAEVARSATGLPQVQSEPPASQPVPDLASEKSNTVRNADGTYTTQFFTDPVNYLADSGSWVPIVNDLAPVAGDTYAAKNIANEYTALIPEDLTATPVKFLVDGAWATMRLRGSQLDDDAPIVDGAEATFDGFGAADSVSFEVLDAGLKESITLRQRPQAPVKFVYDLALSDGLEPVLQSDGSINFVDGDLVKFSMPVGNMEDSAAPEANYSTAVVYELDAVAGGWRLTVVPSNSWLMDVSRVYPVVVDPSLFQNPIRDTWLQQSAPNTSRYGGTYIQVGGVSGTKRRGLLDFGTPLPDGARVDSAVLGLVLDRTQTTSGTAADYALYPAGKQFGNSATWNNSSYAGTWVGGDPAGNVGSSVLTLGGTGSPSYEWMYWDVTEFVTKWHNGLWEPNGMVLKTVGEGSNRVLSFFSSTGGAPYGWKPVVGVNWTPPVCDPLTGFIDGCGAVTPYDDPNGATTDPDDADVDTAPLGDMMTERIAGLSGTWSVPVTNPDTGLKQDINYRKSGDTWWDGICTGDESKYKVIKKYPRVDLLSMEGDYAKMYCGKAVTGGGESAFGIRHIRPEHKEHWEMVAEYDPANHSWGHFMHWALVFIFDEPDRVWYRPASPGRTRRYCHERKFTLKQASGEKIMWAFAALTGKTGQRIITAFPRKVPDEYYCQTLGGNAYQVFP